MTKTMQINTSSSGISPTKSSYRNYCNSSGKSSLIMRSLMLILLGLTLTACVAGGGGSSSPTTEIPSSVGVNAALTSFGIRSFNIIPDPTSINITWRNPANPPNEISNYSVEAVAYANATAETNMSPSIFEDIAYSGNNTLQEIILTNLTEGSYYEFFATAIYVSGNKSDKLAVIQGRLLTGNNSDGDGLADSQDLDDDNDGRVDTADNCPMIANSNQRDNDRDTLGDVCDPDDDNDGIADFHPDNATLTLDVCLSPLGFISNVSNDNDRDGCRDLDEDSDDDNDGIDDFHSNGSVYDNCQVAFNPNQYNNDTDVLGDACDPDDDNDGITDLKPDNTPLDVCLSPLGFISNVSNDHDRDGCRDSDEDSDDDNDGIADFHPDNTPLDDCLSPLGFISNASSDNDRDGCRDSDEDTDDDNDGIADFHSNGSVYDNCQFVANPNQYNNDTDMDGDACDADDDNDNILDIADNCQFVMNTNQYNNDTDADGDACDADDDNDGINDYQDANNEITLDNCQFVANPNQDNNDNDAFGDACDPDDDNDGIADFHSNGSVYDNCQFIHNPDQLDTDDDTLGDACDADDDNDGIADFNPDNTPLDACRLSPRGFISNASSDNDRDGCRDEDEDSDDDNDNVLDTADNCPLNANLNQIDRDEDDMGDVCDVDYDNDGSVDTLDNCRFIYNPRQLNTDTDALGDACDNDIDGDGILNTADDDIDGDGINNTLDFDEDNDGLIEIDNATAFNAMRYNLRGAGLDLLGDDDNQSGGFTTGCGAGGERTTGGLLHIPCNGYELTTDIDLAVAGYDNWEPIGSCGTRSACAHDPAGNPTRVLFSANFSGNGYGIHNLTITRSSNEFPAIYGIGLFGAVAAGVELSNINLTNARISSSANWFVGGLVGYGRGAIIRSASAQLDSISGSQHLGGLVGRGAGARISNSSVKFNSMNANQYIGGLVGWGPGVRISHSSVRAGSIVGSRFQQDVGGLVGQGDGARISYSSAQFDTMQGNSHLGGLVGWANNARISHSSAKFNSMSGNRLGLGGLVGWGQSARISHSSAQAGSITAVDNSVGGLIGGGRLATIVSSAAQTNSISGTFAVGGLVGQAVEAIIESSSAQTGSISGTNHVGGLVGGGFVDAVGITIRSSSAQTNTISGTREVGGLVGNGARAIINYSYSIANRIDATTSDAGGLVGSSVFDAPTSVMASYWDATDFVSMSPVSENTAGDDTERADLTSPTSSIDDESGFADTIYAEWANAYCHPATGNYREFSSDEEISQAVTAGFQRAWSLGGVVEYPTLTCLPIDVDEQRTAITRVLDGEGGSNNPFRPN